MTRKPRILLIPDKAWWVIGEMGKQIIARFGDKYQFYFLPAAVAGRRPDLLKEMVPAIDAIHCISYESIELFDQFDRKELPPIATWIHHVTTWNNVQQRSIEDSSAVTTCTEGWKRYLDERCAGTVAVTVVPHGVDLGFFCRRAGSQGRFGIPPGRFVIGFLGAKSSDFDFGRKGTDILLDVIRKAAISLPDLHVVIGGPGWDQEVEDMRRLNISVSSTGYIRKADLPFLYSALDVYLLTSRVEGGPCTVFEAMACETAVVSTRVGAVPELIVDGVNGYSAAVDDGNALLAAVVELGQNPERRTALAKEGRATVSKRTWHIALSPLEAVYDDLVRQRCETGTRTDGPAWMMHSDGLVRSASAADAILTVYSGVRKKSIGLTKGLRMLQEMLDGLPMIDIVKGFAMIRRYEPKP